MTSGQVFVSAFCWRRARPRMASHGIYAAVTVTTRMSAGTGTRKNVRSPQNMDVPAATITTCLKDTPVSPAWVRVSWVFKAKLDGFRSAAGCHQNRSEERRVGKGLELV